MILTGAAVTAVGKPNRPASTEMTNPNRQLRLID